MHKERCRRTRRASARSRSLPWSGSLFMGCDCFHADWRGRPGLRSAPLLFVLWGGYAAWVFAIWNSRFRGSRPGSARRFYGVLAIAMTMGLAINYAGLDAVKMLFWSAVINGVLAPPLILLILLLTSNRQLMGDRVNSRTLQIVGWITFVIMAAAAIGMFIT